METSTGKKGIRHHLAVHRFHWQADKKLLEKNMFLLQTNTYSSVDFTDGENTNEMLIQVF